MDAAIGMWAKYQCPSCKSINWIPLKPDSPDLSKIDTDAMQCRKCNKIFWYAEVCREETFGETEEEKQANAYTETGSSLVTNEFVYAGTAVFAMRRGKFLMGKRKNTYGAGQWALPGGKPDFGEFSPIAAAREVEEETGLKVVNLKKVGWQDEVWKEHGLHFVTLFFIGDIVGDEPARNMETNRNEGWIEVDLKGFFFGDERMKYEPIFACLGKIVEDRESLDFFRRYVSQGQH